ncbi:MAG TPA: hypothetical protein VJY39_15210 [Acidisphaera sp.]|nr:hypothetical protein [Acidisphaera sp.]
MRVLYADPGLRNTLGHHANSCRAIRGELQRRGIEVVVLALNTVIPELRAELQAIPLFRAFSYWLNDGDPFAGWLNAFDKSSRATAEDLSRINGIGPDDLVYLNSSQPPQLRALILWAQSMPLERRPHIVLEFGTDPGVDVAVDEAGRTVISPRDYRADARPMFYRFSASHLSDADLTRFHMTTFDPTSSTLYSHVLGKPVGVLPSPQFTRGTIIDRSSRRPVTVAVLVWGLCLSRGYRQWRSPHRGI